MSKRKAEDLAPADTTLEEDIRAAIEGDAGGDDGDDAGDVEKDMRAAMAGGSDDDAGSDEAGGSDPGGGGGGDGSDGDDAGPGDAPEGSGDPAAALAGVEPPEHWSAEDKARFSALPDEATRQTVLEWRKQIERGASEKFEAAARERREIEQLMEPVAQELRLAGLTPIDGIRRLVGAETLLRTDPARGLEWLAQNYGRLVAGTGQAHEIVRRVATALGVEVAGNGKTEPETAEARRIAALEARFIEQERARQQAWAEQQAQTVNAATSAIREFADAKDSNGKPTHPHFERVKVQMGALMQSGAAQDLEDAYQRAVWADPEIREELTKAEREKAARAAEAARQASVAKAKVARTPATASVPTRTAEDDEDEPIEVTIRKAHERQQAASRARI